MSLLQKKNDIIEIYSFGIFLNLHIQFTYYILSNFSIFSSAFYLFIMNFITGFVCKFSLFQLIIHPFWFKEFYSISLPIFTNSILSLGIHHIPIPKDFFINRYVIEGIILFGMSRIMKSNFPKENDNSKIFRFNIMIFYFALMLYF